MHELITTKQFGANGIEAASAKADFALVRIGRGPSLQYVADTKDELSRLEVLCKIIVCALLKSVDAVLGLGHRTQ